MFLEVRALSGQTAAMPHRALVLLAGALTAAAMFGAGTSPAHATAPSPTQPGGVVLDGWGGLHTFGGASLNRAGAPFWPNWDIARSVVVLPDGSGGWTLDGWGGIHQWGVAPAIATPAYWPGWDIARALVVLPDEASGYVLDGWGGLHAFGSAPPLTIGYWPGWDIARGFDVRLDAQNHVIGAAILDGWGAVHSIGNYGSGSPPGYPGTSAYRALHNVNGHSYSVAAFGVVRLIDQGLLPYWSGYPDWGAWDINRDVVLFAVDNPSPTAQPVSPWSWNGYLRATGQPYDVGYVPACGIAPSVRSAAAQVIAVSIECQRLSAYQDGQMVAASPVTTARPGRITPRGWHHILWKRSPWAVLFNVTYGPVVRVQYGMGFDTIGDIFHDAPWEPAWAYGLASSLLPPYGSHGCVHVPPQQLGVLYGWVQVGATVYIN